MNIYDSYLLVICYSLRTGSHGPVSSMSMSTDDKKRVMFPLAMLKYVKIR